MSWVMDTGSAWLTLSMQEPSRIQAAVKGAGVGRSPGE